MELPWGSRGLDAGCGVGLPALLLAEATGPEGRVIGLDASFESLAQAKRLAHKAGLWGRVTFQPGDVNELPFADGVFDWVWSADCAGLTVKRPGFQIEEFARVVKPGGTVALLAWSSQQLLPGHPFLEARLNATAAGVAPFTAAMEPERHFQRTLGWLCQAGLEETAVETLSGQARAPLSEDIRAALISLLEMRWEGARSEATAEDWAEYQRLCDPNSPDFILNLPDYYAFFTYSLFWGRVSRKVI